MSELRSFITEVTGFDASGLSAEELGAEIVEAVHAQQMLECAVAGWTKNLADRHGHEELGCSSPTNLLVDQGRMSPGEAKQVVARGNARQKAPYAYAAWVDGRLSTSQARHLFAAAEAVPDSYPQAEERLVDIVEGLDVVDTAKTVEYWRQSVDGPGESDAETLMARRGLSLSKTTGGMRRVDGWLTPTAGAALETALTALTPPKRTTDTRTPRQRRHDALDDLTRTWLDNGTTPTIGGEKPHVLVHTNIDALQGIAGGLHETSDGTILDVDMLRMVACDCSVSRIIFGADSEVLDIGRKTRVWTTAQRRAITARDRHCQGPGCRTKPEHCDIHHETHWATGGTTTVEKGTLLSRPCHTLQHTKDKYQRRRRSRT